MLPEKILQQLRDAGVDMSSRAACIDPSGGGPRLFFVMADPEENGFCVQAAR